MIVRQNPWEALLPQMLMLKFKHGLDMDIADKEIAAAKVVLEDKRHNEKIQKGKETKQRLTEAGYTPSPSGEMENVFSGNRFRPPAKPEEKKGFTVVKEKGRWVYKSDPRDSTITQYNAAVADKSWNPVKTKGDPMSGGIADYRLRMARARATPFSEKVKLKQTPTKAQEENLKLSKERLQLAKDQKIVQMQGRAIEAEQQILGDPSDPRAATSVTQFQQNAGAQPYMYVSRQQQGWFGGKTTKNEKVTLPKDPRSGRQITAKDVMDTLKANPNKYRTVEEVLKALGAI